MSGISSTLVSSKKRRWDSFNILSVS